MLIQRGRRDLPRLVHESVTTIGNFDGVHLGHQQLLCSVTSMAKRRGMQSAVVLFEPHPNEFFLSEPPARLMSFREKVDVLKTFGIDQVLVLRFSADLASMAAQEFIEAYLVQALNTQHLVIGDDFRFGYKRAGDFSLLQQDSRFSCEASETVLLNGERVSSTSVRLALANAQFDVAAALLGRPYTLNGKVAHGDRRGRQLGFPTANIRLRRKTLPLNGVYAVEVQGLNGTTVSGVANIGSRPTVNGREPRCEIHLFNFAQDIYGERLSVKPVHFIRAEQKFDGLDALKTQIAIDCEQAKQYFTQNGQRV